MSSKTRATKPQMLIQETLHTTKKFFHKSFTNLKTFVSQKHRKLHKHPLQKPIFNSGSQNINDKLQELDNFCKSYTEKWDSSNEVIIKKREEQTKVDEKTPNKIGLKDSKEEKNATKKPPNKQDQESNFLAAEALALKMKELEMMDVTNDDHFLDLEEVLHSYSNLTCPAYVEIVDKFFMDMYSEFNLPEPSRSIHGSMRKVGSNSIHNCSMRSLGPLKI